MTNNGKITWTTEQRRLGDLREWDKNPRQLSKHDAQHIKTSLDKFGVADPLIINQDGSLIGGHQRKHILKDANLMVDVRVPSRQLDEREAEELAIRLNKNSGDWDWDILANEFDVPDLLEWGFTEFQLGINNPNDPNAEWKGMPEFEQEDLSPMKAIKVNFSSEDNIREFAELIGQTVTINTRSIWYPKAIQQDDSRERYSNES